MEGIMIDAVDGEEYPSNHPFQIVRNQLPHELGITSQ